MVAPLLGGRAELHFLQLCGYAVATLQSGLANVNGRVPVGREGRVAFSATLRPLCSYSAGGPGQRQRSRRCWAGGQSCIFCNSAAILRSGPAQTPAVMPLLGGKAELHFLQLCGFFAAILRPRPERRGLEFYCHTLWAGVFFLRP